MNLLESLTERKIAHPPRWLPNNVIYMTIMGSQAYGVTHDDSDMDIYGIAIPMKDDLFPHLRGEIIGFGRQHQKFEQYQEHHLKDDDAVGGRGREYDITIFSIVKFFQLAMENNPNIIDSLFVPHTCIIHSTPVGNLIRENRRLFLHKGGWFKFKGYAYAQLHKLKNKNPSGKRKDLVEKHGYDTKFAYHILRLLLEIEQAMVEGDIDLQRHREQLKAVRRGEWSEQDIREWFTSKEAALEKVYHDSPLRYKPDEAAIKQLLIDCLEHHYGSLENCVINPDATVAALRNIQAEIEKVRNLL